MNPCDFLMSSVVHAGMQRWFHEQGLFYKSWFVHAGILAALEKKRQIDNFYENGRSYRYKLYRKIFPRCLTIVSKGEKAVFAVYKKGRRHIKKNNGKENTRIITLVFQALYSLLE